MTVIKNCFVLVTLDNHTSYINNCIFFVFEISIRFFVILCSFSPCKMFVSPMSRSFFKNVRIFSYFSVFKSNFLELRKIQTFHLRINKKKIVKLVFFVILCSFSPCKMFVSPMSRSFFKNFSIFIFFSAQN